jgi:MYXO-CTERM domain-containing protein
MKIRNIAAALLIALGGAGAANAAADIQQTYTNDSDPTGLLAMSITLGAGDWRINASAEADAPLISFSLFLGTSLVDPDPDSVISGTHLRSASYYGLDAGQYTLKAITAPDTEVTISASAFKSVTTPVPEAETYALALAGLGVVGLLARRRAA